MLPNPPLLIQPYITREALASSRIEGTRASLSDVFDAQARNKPEGPIREVTNYIRALQRGMLRLDALPVSRRLLCEVHEVLLSDVRGRERLPGKVRRSQNWIGSPDNRPETAVFVIALVHYQFETIHPFLDGNGRLGRLLIAFLLVEQQLLPQPLLYLSAYFEHHRSEYYDRLQAVRERGELREWLVSFLTGVAELANDAVDRAERLVDLRERYRQRLSGDRSRAVEVIDLVFQNPVLTTTRIAETLDTTLQSALNHVRRLESAGIVSEARGVPGRSKRWISTEVFHALDPEASAIFSDDDEALPDHAGTTSSP